MCENLNQIVLHLSSSTSIFKAVGYSGTILSSPDGISMDFFHLGFSELWDIKKSQRNHLRWTVHLWRWVGIQPSSVHRMEPLGQKGILENPGILVELHIWKQDLCGGGLERNHLLFIGWNHMDFKNFWNDKIP